MSNIGYDQRFECMLCFEKRNRFMVHRMVDVNAETFDKYNIEDHLKNKHSIDEILGFLAAHHVDIMLMRTSPTSSCKFPDSMRAIDMGTVVRRELDDFGREYTLKFKKKKPVKKNPYSRLKPRSKLLKERKKALKVKARITHK